MCPNCGYRRTRTRERNAAPSNFHTDENITARQGIPFFFIPCESRAFGQWKIQSDTLLIMRSESSGINLGLWGARCALRTRHRYRARKARMFIPFPALRVTPCEADLAAADPINHVTEHDSRRPITESFFCGGSSDWRSTCRRPANNTREPSWSRAPGVTQIVRIPVTNSSGNCLDRVYGGNE